MRGEKNFGNASAQFQNVQCLVKFSTSEVLELVYLSKVVQS